MDYGVANNATSLKIQYLNTKEVPPKTNSRNINTPPKNTDATAPSKRVCSLLKRLKLGNSYVRMSGYVNKGGTGPFQNFPTPTYSRSGSKHKKGGKSYPSKPKHHLKPKKKLN